MFKEGESNGFSDRGAVFENYGVSSSAACSPREIQSFAWALRYGSTLRTYTSRRRDRRGPLSHTDEQKQENLF
jgi:hypothetical protein